jgi:EmrB/QacA subfamily drug resistance transporter
MSSEIITRRRWLGLVAVLLGQFMLLLDATAVNVALPAMRADLALAPSELTWIQNTYLIAFGGLLLLFGRLGDLFGRPRVFVFGLGLFTAASIACGLAPDATTLIVSRFVQGIGAAAASSVILAIISTEFPGEQERARAMSGFMFVSVAGGSIGLFVGGLLTQLLSWHWIFLINVPVGIFGIWLARRALTKSTPTRGTIDIVGAVLVTAASTLASYGLVAAARGDWSATEVRLPLVAAVVLGIVFFFLESTLESPLFPLRMLRIRGLVVTSIIRGFMVMGLYGVFFVASLDMSGTLGFGPLRTGLAFLPQTMMVAVMSLGLARTLVAKFGPRRVLVGGLALAACGFAVMANLAIDAPYFPLRGLAHAMLGLGFGAAFLPLLVLAMADVLAKDAGLGSAIVNLSMQLSAAVDLAILVTLITRRTRSLSAAGEPLRAATVHGYRFGYAIAVAAVAVGVMLAATLLRDRPRDSLR